MYPWRRQYPCENIYIRKGLKYGVEHCRTLVQGFIRFHATFNIQVIQPVQVLIYFPLDIPGRPTRDRAKMAAISPGTSSTCTCDSTSSLTSISGCSPITRAVANLCVFGRKRRLIVNSVRRAPDPDEPGGRGMRYVRRSSFSETACDESNDVSDW
jgi:hypothetical protein